MHFPPYWALAKKDGAICWGWSDESISQAKYKAEDGASRVAARLKSGDLQRKSYEYGSRPLREEVIKRVEESRGDLITAITRNSYGALVLNSSRALFLDIDGSGVAHAGLMDSLRRLFGGKSSGLQTKVEEWLTNNRDWGLRLYKTAAGYRLLATHSTFSPERISELKIFSDLGVDPLYKKLCENQKSFRARLTPKPWRCNLGIPPARWPFENSSDAERFREWEKSYAKATESLATCAFIAHLGNTDTRQEISGIVKLHDEQTRANTGLPLA